MVIRSETVFSEPTDAPRTILGYRTECGRCILFSGVGSEPGTATGPQRTVLARSVIRPRGTTQPTVPTDPVRYVPVEFLLNDRNSILREPSQDPEEDSEPHGDIIQDNVTDDALHVPELGGDVDPNDALLRGLTGVNEVNLTPFRDVPTFEDTHDFKTTSCDLNDRIPQPGQNPRSGHESLDDTTNNTVANVETNPLLTKRQRMIAIDKPPCENLLTTGK